MSSMDIYDKVDRISSLPDSLIHQIMSSMDTKFAVQTSILSTRWTHLWKSLPFLKLDSEMFQDGSAEYETIQFRTFVEHVLLRRDNSSGIQAFRLEYNGYDVFSPHLFPSWIVYAIRHNVQELHLDVYNEVKIECPPCLFTAKSLKILKLNIQYEYHNEYMFELPDSISLPSLKTLHLESLRFVNEDLTSRLLSHCPVLESLTVQDCDVRFLKNLIISAPQLKHLELKSLFECWNILSEGCKIKINSQNLSSFKFIDTLGSNYQIESCSAVDNVDINIEVPVYYEASCGLFKKCMELNKKVYVERAISCFKAVRDAKDLTLSASLIEFLSEPPAILEGLPLQFCNLKALKLKTWLSRDCIPAVLHLLSVCPNIETLRIEIDKGPRRAHPMYPYWDEKKSNSECSREYSQVKFSSRGVLHHLKIVEMCHAIGCFNELKFLEILLESTVVLEEMVVFASPELPERRWKKINFEKNLLAFPRASSSTKISLL